MPPIYGHPNYDFDGNDYPGLEISDNNYPGHGPNNIFSGQDFSGSKEDWSAETEFENQPSGLTEMAFWYMIALVAMLLLWLFMFFCLRLIALRQKTRNPQQRRMYVGSRPRQSLTPQEPTIYVSPSNLPPPPKYECLAPPSYEEVVGIHYPNYQGQPITQPINTALTQAQGPSVQHNVTNNVTNSVIMVNETAPAPTAPRRTSVTAA